METIGNLINSVKLGSQPQNGSSECSVELPVSTLETRRENTLKALPLWTDCERWMCPERWSTYTGNMDQSLTGDVVFLSELDSLYGETGLAKKLLAVNIEGIYTLAMVKNDTPAERARIISLASDMFLIRFGASCSLYAMMVYFANYYTEFKSLYVNFDVQDIMRKKKKKFVKWWNVKRERALKEVAKQRKERSISLEPVGETALRIYIRDCLRSDYDIRTGYLYENGMVTDKMISEEQVNINNGIF